jgi:restriction system protein
LHENLGRSSFLRCFSIHATGAIHKQSTIVGSGFVQSVTLTKVGCKTIFEDEDRLKAEAPAVFERIVIELLVKMGYGGSRADAAQAIGKSGDEGLDGIIKEDRLGLDTIYVQAKRWAATVGRPEIQKFAGALHGQHATKGIFITTSDFSKDANDYVSKIGSKIILIDGSRLAELMIEFGVAVATEATYTVKRIDNDFFESV